MDAQAFEQRVGALIRQHRLRRNVTQQQLAHQLGVSRTSVTNIEQGSQSTTLFFSARLAALLEIDLSSLVAEAASGDIFASPVLQEAMIEPDLMAWVDSLSEETPGGKRQSS